MKKISLEHTIRNVVNKKTEQHIDEAVGVIGTDKPHEIPNAFFKTVHINPRKGEEQIKASGPTRARRNYEMEKAGVRKEEAEQIDELVAAKEGLKFVVNMFKAPTGNLPAVVSKTKPPAGPVPKPSTAPPTKPSEPPPFAEPTKPKPIDLPPIAPEPKVPAAPKPDVKPPAPDVKPPVVKPPAPDVKPPVKPEPETLPKPKPVVVPKTKPEPETLPQPEPEPKTGTLPQPKTETLPKPETATAPAPSTKIPTPTKGTDSLKRGRGINLGGGTSLTEPSAAAARVPVPSRIAIPHKRRQAHFEETRYDIKNVARSNDKRNDAVVGRSKSDKSKYTKQAEIIRKVFEEKKITLSKKKEEKMGANPMVNTEPKLKHQELDQGS